MYDRPALSDVFDCLGVYCMENNSMKDGTTELKETIFLYKHFFTSKVNSVPKLELHQTFYLP